MMFYCKHCDDDPTQPRYEHKKHGVLFEHVKKAHPGRPNGALIGHRAGDTEFTAVTNPKTGTVHALVAYDTVTLDAKTDCGATVNVVGGRLGHAEDAEDDQRCALCDWG